MTLSSASSVRLRPATPGDAPMLALWDREPHVIRGSTDDPAADIGRRRFGEDDGLVHRLERAVREGRARP